MSKWYGVDALYDAVDMTRKLMTPVDTNLWLKLAVIAVIAGGIGVGNTNLLGNLEENPLNTNIDYIMAAALIAATIVLAVIILGYLSAVAQFAYVKALLEKNVKLTAYFIEQKSNGLKLFLLQLTIILIISACLAAAIVGGIIFFGGMELEFFAIAAIVAAALTAAAAFIAFALTVWLIIEFTVPVMYKRGCGLFEAIKTVSGLIKSNIIQVAIYLTIYTAVSIAAAIPVLMLSFIFYFITFTGFFLIGLGLYVGLDSAGEAAVEAATTPIILAGMLVSAVVQVAVTYTVTLITLPLNVFLKYYKLAFLSKIYPSLGLFAKPADATVHEGEKPPRGDDSIREVRVY